MRILLSNDDGIDAPGLKALIAPLSTLGELIIAAPAYQQTAKGHAMTIDGPIRVEQEVCEGHEAYRIHGTPKDCVDIAITCLLKDRRPDLVVTGINEGPNLSNDCVSSGTIGAATAGFLQKIPSIATSLMYGDGYPYERCAPYVVKYARWFVEQPFNKDFMLSVNFPNVERFAGEVVAATGGEHLYLQGYIRSEKDGQVYYTAAMEAPAVVNVVPDLDHDLYAIQHGYIVLQPMDYDLVRYESLEPLRRALAEGKNA
jgi:5'-nucleotidase